MAETEDRRFSYDSNDNLDIRESGEEVFDEIAVHDINFCGATDRRINAYLVTPTIGHSFPGILFVHPMPGSRRTFLDEALKLAEHRICSIAVDAPWSAGMDWAKRMGDPAHDRNEFIGSIEDLRRSIDVLTSLSIVDGGRLGFVGHSLGALCGAVLSGVDRRVKNYVLMSGTSSFSEVAEANMSELKGETLSKYKRTLSDIDPIRFVPRASPSSIMFQMGRSEEAFDHQSMQALADALASRRSSNGMTPAMRSTNRHNGIATVGW
jgi:cephalosporin-C deacetylase-like acetyl esterase